ncbi:putative thymidilate kinase [Pseudomonas phage IR-QUMS-PaBa1-GHS-2021]|nr:putative thymidilate kinase [Pseudomonas phage IR-QUMS-PaBa1-GHS-2021]
MNFASLYSGMFCVVEGLDGTGKTTVVNRITDWLVERGVDVVKTREPGGTPYCNRIRDLLLSLDEGGEGPCQMTELLLFNAARVQHLETLVKPRLQAGKFVLCDRYVHTTIAYQGEARGLGVGKILELHRLLTQDFWPHFTFILDAPVEVVLDRVHQRGGMNRLDSQTVEFYEKARTAYRRMGQTGRDCALIDATVSEDEVFNQMTTYLERLCNKY